MRRVSDRPFVALVFFLAAGAFLTTGAPPLQGDDPGAPAHRVADLATVPAPVGVEPRIAGRHGGHVYFHAFDPTRGRSLWRTDGTAAGTEPFLDFCPGACGAEVTAFASFGDRFLFVTGADRREGDVRLWVSDGSREGTAPIHRFGYRFAPQIELAVAGDRVFFQDSDREHGLELWSSDGTAEGTAMHDDVCPGPCDGHPFDLTPFGDGLAFTAATPATGREPWRAGPVAGGALRLADTCPGGCGTVDYLAAHSGLLYFNGTETNFDGDPWVSDGTVAGTRRLVDVAPGTLTSGLQYSFEIGAQVYLVLATPPVQPKLWRTDGTPEGTVPAFEVLGALAGWDIPSFAPPAAGGRLYFWALRNGESRRTFLAFEAATGTTRELGTDLSTWSNTALPFEPLGESLLFLGREDGIEDLWVSDGTAAGTRLLHRTSAAGHDTILPFDFAVLGGRQVFVAGSEGRQVWASDGTLPGTRSLEVSTEPSSSPEELTPFDGRLAFTATRDGFLRELWTTTADDSGAVSVPGSVQARHLTPSSGGLVFARVDDDHSPWLLPGPDEVPVRLADIPLVHELEPTADGRVFFVDVGEGQRLWVTDGTPGGTRLVTALAPDWVDDCFPTLCDPAIERFQLNLPDRLTAVGDALYFRATGSETDRSPSLFRSDGTEAGTVRVDAVPGQVDTLAPLGDSLVFTVTVPNEGWQVWRIEASGAADRVAEHGGSWPGPLTPADGAVYYVVEERRVQDGMGLVSTGLALHRLAGGAPESERLGTLGDALELDAVVEVAAVGRRLYLAVDDPTTGRELWTSDGTAAGTGPLADLRPGPRGSHPSSLTPVGSFLLFGADDGESGHEPWVTDGTAAGTFRVADVNPGPEPSGPAGFARVGERIYFAADDGERGRELWAVDLAALAGEDPAEVPDDAVGIVAPEYPGFRFWVRITAGGSGGSIQPARRELLCIPETVCVSGALPGRSELFLRIVGPRPNGFLWPTLVRFSTSRIEVWIEQVSTGALQHYVLDAATPGSDELDGLFDRRGFQVD
jgi:ELWxxDGT repeat protein